MRSLAAYLVAGIVVVLAMDFVAAPVGLGLAMGGWPSVEAKTGSTLQFVDRAGKGDRLPKLGKQHVPPKPSVLVGCDPVFSPLSASASANFSGRCIA